MFNKNCIVLFHYILLVLSCFSFNFTQDPSKVLCGRDARYFFKIKFDLNTGNSGALSESKPFPCTNSFREKRLSILASWMANLFKFHAVYSSSTLIRLDKDAFEGHLCQTVNNFVKQNKSSLLSPLRKRRPPQHIKHIRNTRVSQIPTLVNLAARRCTLSILSLLYFWYGSQTVAPYSIKERIKEK